MENLSTHSFLKKYHPALLRWYDKNHRNLPWRDTNDPYFIWISEVMLQQTQVRTVIPYYTRFIQRFPTVQKLANARQQTVLKMWEGLGYYSRARNLHHAAQTVVHEYEGLLPRDWKQIRSLPGIGDYIAAAVLSIAFNQPHAVLDGNVKRVIARLFCVDLPINQSSSKKAFSNFANKMLYGADPGKYNQAIMELGALVCTPGNPACNFCPIQSFCCASQSVSVIDYPRKLKSKSTPSYNLVAAVIIKGNKILITKRPEKGLLGGLWEFPGGLINKAEKPQEACLRSIKDSTGLTIDILDYLTSIKHAYTHFKIKMDVFLCRSNSISVELNGPVAYRWVDIEDLDKFPLHKANHKFLPRLRKVWKEL